VPLPGWYPDPRREAKSRWHDGEQWTERTSDAVDGPEADATIEVATAGTQPASLKSRVNRWAVWIGAAVAAAALLRDALVK
jgi:hypothetical protein